MSNIYDLANELSRGIRDLPEYKAVLASKEAIDADADAKALFGDYLVFQQEIHGVIQSGQMPTEDQQKKMQDFAEKLQGNPIVNEFFTKQQQLSVYLGDIERIILIQFKIYLNKGEVESPPLFLSHLRGPSK